MQDKGLSFKPYWKKEKENFEKEGMQPSLDYPLFNDMINGMLFKSFDEILKSKDSSNMSYNPQKNKFLQNFKLYLNELKRDVSKVYQVIELELHRIQRNCNKYMATVTKPEGKTLAPKIEGLYNRLQLIAKFAQFNYDIYNHVIKKIGKTFVKLEKIDFEGQAFQSLSTDKAANSMFCQLRAKETCYLLILLENRYAQYHGVQGQGHLRRELETIEENLRNCAVRFLKKRPDGGVVKVIKAYDERLEAIREEMKKRFGNDSPTDNFHVRTTPETRQVKEQEIQLPEKIQDSERKPIISSTVIGPKDVLIGGRKPNGEDHLAIDDNVDGKFDDEMNDDIDHHRVRDLNSYYFDIESLFKTKNEACYSVTAPWFVLVHTFFYMLTYYGITPTTYDYNLLMGVPKEYFGLMSALTPFVAAISCFTYNYFTKVHYKSSYYVSILCIFLGSFFYNFAFGLKSLPMLLIGRAFLGYGSARIVTRKFFTSQIHIDHRILWSAMLVGFTGMSMTLGPGLSALLETLIDSEAAHSVKLDNFSKLSSAEQDAIMDVLTGFKIGAMRFSKVNYVTLITMIVYFVMLFIFIFFYQDTPSKAAPQQGEGEEAMPEHESLEYQASEINHVHWIDHDNNFPHYEVEERKKKLHGFKQKLAEAVKYFTDKQTYYVCLYFFIIKAIQEAIIVESPAYIIKNYKYTSAVSGLIFFLFTFVSLPIALVPSFLKSRYQDRAVLRMSSYFLIAAMVLKCQFSASLYPFGIFIAGSCAVLSFSLAVETCCSSIVTKVISEKKARSFMNAGILSGLIDTLGRVAGSTSITIITSFADYSILNCILYPFWLAVFGCVVLALVTMYARLDSKTYLRFGPSN